MAGASKASKWAAGEGTRDQLMARAPRWNAADAIYHCEASARIVYTDSRHFNVEIMSDPYEGCVNLSVADALTLARWILETFTESDEVPSDDDRPARAGLTQ